MQTQRTPAAPSPTQGHRRNGVAEWQDQARARRHTLLTVGTTDHRPVPRKPSWYEIPRSHETAWIVAMATIAGAIFGACRSELLP